MKFYTGVDWSDWDILPVLRVGREAPSFCGEASIWYLAIGWGPFQLSIESE